MERARESKSKIDGQVEGSRGREEGVTVIRKLGQDMDKRKRERAKVKE